MVLDVIICLTGYYGICMYCAVLWAQFCLWKRKVQKKKWKRNAYKLGCNGNSWWDDPRKPQGHLWALTTFPLSCCSSESFLLSTPSGSFLQLSCSYLGVGGGGEKKGTPLLEAPTIHWLLNEHKMLQFANYLVHLHCCEWVAWPREIPVKFPHAPPHPMLTIYFLIQPTWNSPFLTWFHPVA